MSEVEARDHGRSLQDVAFLLLLLQGGVAVLTAIGGILLQFFAPGFRGVLVSAGLEAATALFLIALASGILRSKHWAYVWTLRMEVMVLAGSSLTLFLQFGVSLTLGFAVAQVLLPLAIMIIVLSRRESFDQPHRDARVTATPEPG